MERFPRQGYLNTPTPSDGFWLVYEMLDRKINQASTFSPPCPHTAPSRPGHAPWQQRFLPGRAPPAACSGSRSVLERGSGRSTEPPSLPPTREWVRPQLRPALLKAPPERPAGAVVGLFFSAVIFKTLTFRGISQILPVKT